eukprot:TRINITY_DN69349_c0_g1_i1.p1 TRINITY_DN69349_c0_g1~~TRINITY_DN69349_c0_g1_i1.p1  ORF type:complete len:366 (-),score=47.74 TRINITY_DN69349_c0_g1_i1:57-1154(-)
MINPLLLFFASTLLAFSSLVHGGDVEKRVTHRVARRARERRDTVARLQSRLDAKCRFECSDDASTQNPSERVASSGATSNDYRSPLPDVETCRQTHDACYATCHSGREPSADEAKRGAANREGHPKAACDKAFASCLADVCAAEPVDLIGRARQAWAARASSDRSMSLQDDASTEATEAEVVSDAPETLRSDEAAARPEDAADTPQRTKERQEQRRLRRLADAHPTAFASRAGRLCLEEARSLLSMPSAVNCRAYRRAQSAACGCAPAASTPIDAEPAAPDAANRKGAKAAESTERAGASPSMLAQDPEFASVMMQRRVERAQRLSAQHQRRATLVESRWRERLQRLGGMWRAILSENTSDDDEL